MTDASDAPAAAAAAGADAVRRDPVDDFDFFDDQDDLADGPRPVDRHEDRQVVAVLVVHDGMDWLPVSLAALLAQERPADRIVAVDTGSDDGSTDLLTRTLPVGAVITRPRGTGFGAAVQAGIDAAGPCDWVWVLHDDCAPRADALLHLLDVGERGRGVAAVGPKVLGWADRTHLLEIGVTIGRGGRRETGLERSERDQGQHDQERDVLAVGSAGMLVRRSRWDAVGGFDPDLPLFRDDVDLGWRLNAAGDRVVLAPDAVVHHAEAATHRRRPADAVGGRPERADRLHAMRVVLANSGRGAVPFLALGLVLSALGRAVGFLVGKDVEAARDELGALGALLRHPGVVSAMRRRRAALVTVPPSELASLRPPPGAQVRQAAEAVAGILGGGAAEPARPGGAVESGPAEDDDVAGLVDSGPGVVSRALRRPGVLAGLVLTVVALLAVRALLGSGRLQGGALLPAPDGAGDWWSLVTDAWHPVALGSTLPSPPGTAVLAAGATALLGRAPAVVDLLLLAGVPAAFVVAFLALRGIVGPVSLRLWAAATYALLPTVTIATATGRLGTMTVAVLLPALLRSLAHVAGIGPHRPGPRAAWGTGLLLAVVGGFVPLLWLMAAIAGAVAAATVARSADRRRAIALTLAVPWVLWLPWSLHLLRTPSAWLLETGVDPVGISAADVSPWDLLALDPGGPGAGPWWAMVGVVLVALTALLRRARRPLLIGGWWTAGGCLVLALVLSWVTVTPVSSGPVPAWPGPALLVAGAVLLLVGAVGSEGALRRLSATRFSGRQVLAVVVAATAVIAPLLAATSWMARGAGDPLDRAPAEQLPAFLALQAQGPAQPRTLVLDDQGGRIGYAIARSGAQIAGAGDVATPTADQGGLPALVSDVVSGAGGLDAARLGRYGIAYVLVRSPDALGLAPRLDASPGLARLGSPDGSIVWQVQGTVSRVRFEPTRGRASVLAAGPVSATAPVPRAWPGGRIVTADIAAPGWRATLDGRALTPIVVDGWAQGWELPAGSTGEVRIEYRDGLRPALLLAVGVALVVVIVLALPARRRPQEVDA